MKGRTFSDLEKNKSRKNLRKFIKEFAYNYANSEYGLARTYFTKYYNISISCYEKLLDKAIIWNIVDDEIMRKILEKKCHNSTANSGSSARVYEKYARLVEERKQYKRFPFTKKEVIKIVVEFTEDRYLTKKALADIYCVTLRDIDKALYVACVNCWIDDVLFKKLKDRSLERTNDEAASKFFEDLESRREIFKKLQKEKK